MINKSLKIVIKTFIVVWIFRLVLFYPFLPPFEPDRKAILYQLFKLLIEKSIGQPFL